mmetsp:Transcript_30070/g.75998  ORF Transcript_30070/g.75998 Transcript_30070/m.75998 type:complete len:111 (+) Transcript_30070:796-1128(+)
MRPVFSSLLGKVLQLPIRPMILCHGGLLHTVCRALVGRHLLRVTDFTVVKPWRWMVSAADGDPVLAIALWWAFAFLGCTIFAVGPFGASSFSVAASQKVRLTCASALDEQ